MSSLQSFGRELVAVWRRQKQAWHVVVTWMVVNRFLRRFVEQYATIYVRLLGASPVQLGAAQSAAGLAGTIISLPMGIAQDRYSLRRIYLAGITLLTIAPLLYAIAPSWQWLIPGVALLGLGHRLGSCSVICDVSLPNRDRATGKALCEGVGSLPTLLGPIAAAAVVMLLGGVSVHSVRTLYWIYFAVGIVPTIYAYRRMPEIHRERPAATRLNVLADLREVFRGGRALKRYAGLVATSEFALVMLMTFMYPYAYEIGSATPFVLGAMSTAVTLAEVVFSTVFGRLADRLGRKRAYLMLTPLFVSGNLLLILSPTPGLMVVAGLMFGFRMISSVVYSSIGPELVPANCIGRWRGMVGVVQSLAAMAAPIIGGYLWEGLGPQAIFAVVTAVDLVIAVPLVLALPETLHRAERD